jgi:DNA-binding IclR family transcriptional regulator
MLAVLDAFSPERPTLTTEEIMTEFGYSRGTAYRYVAVLMSTGFLSKVGGYLSLGPRIIELDYFIRQSDLDLQAIQPVLRSVSERCECDVILASFFDDRIVVRHHERGTDQLTMSYGRGRRMPLCQGAASKAILAALPLPRQKRLFTKFEAEVKKAGLGSTWKEFRSKLASLRKAGYVTSKGELDAGNVGISAPIFLDSPPNLPGSLALIFSAKRFALADEKLIAQICMDAASQINLLISNHLRTGVPVHWLQSKKPA